MNSSPEQVLKDVFGYEQFRGPQREIIEELLTAGARLEDEEFPTGHEEIDAILRQHRAV